MTAPGRSVLPPGSIRQTIITESPGLRVVTEQTFQRTPTPMPPPIPRMRSSELYTTPGHPARVAVNVGQDDRRMPRPLGPLEGRGATHINVTQTVNGHVLPGQAGPGRKDRVG